MSFFSELQDLRLPTKTLKSAFVYINYRATTDLEIKPNSRCLVLYTPLAFSSDISAVFLPNTDIKVFHLQDKKSEEKFFEISLRKLKSYMQVELNNQSNFLTADVRKRTSLGKLVIGTKR